MSREEFLPLAAGQFQQMLKVADRDFRKDREGFESLFSIY